MSAHLELDFNDDGTITLTHRPTKGSMFHTSITEANDSDVAKIGVKAGDDETVTHEIHIGTVAVMQAAERYAA